MHWMFSPANAFLNPVLLQHHPALSAQLMLDKVGIDPVAAKQLSVLAHLHDLSPDYDGDDICRRRRQHEQWRCHNRDVSNIVRTEQPVTRGQAKQDTMMATGTSLTGTTFLKHGSTEPAGAVEPDSK